MCVLATRLSRTPVCRVKSRTRGKNRRRWSTMFGSRTVLSFGPLAAIRIALVLVGFGLMLFVYATRSRCTPIPKSGGWYRCSHRMRFLHGGGAVLLARHFGAPVL